MRYVYDVSFKLNVIKFNLIKRDQTNNLKHMAVYYIIISEN